MDMRLKGHKERTLRISLIRVLVQDNSSILLKIPLIPHTR